MQRHLVIVVLILCPTKRGMFCCICCNFHFRSFALPGTIKFVRWRCFRAAQNAKAACKRQLLAGVAVAVHRCQWHSVKKVFCRGVFVFAAKRFEENLSEFRYQRQVIGSLLFNNKQPKQCGGGGGVPQQCRKTTTTPKTMEAQAQSTQDAGRDVQRDASKWDLLM